MIESYSSIFDEDRLMPQSCTVYEQDSYSEKTGILDVNGRMIYHNYKNDPIGFIYINEV